MTFFGKLSLTSIPTEPVKVFAMLFIVAVVIGAAVVLTVAGKWRYVWREWLTSLDHKKIGVMYILLANIMLARGLVDASMMRTQQALTSAQGVSYLPPEHYDQLFSAHGTIMVFFMAMPFIVGLLNIVLPLQIGARDVAFPFLNAITLWLNVAGAMLVNAALFFGSFSRTGWLAYPPLSETAFSPSVGVDYWIWAIQVAGAGSLLTGINFLVTIANHRAPGMTLGRLPIFGWTTIATSALIVAAFPILTVTSALLAMDRYLGAHFFTPTGGGDPMMYVNLIWSWGHPEVYILALPAFGIFSCVIPCFSGKPLFGYTSMVAATIAIMLLSFVVWVHHFFTMGAGADVNGFFGLMTMVIAVPTGVKVFAWLLTMYGGRIRLTTAMLWSIAFILTFTIGGMTGVVLSLPAADFVLHNSLFLIAHFHNVLIGGTLFGFFAGYNYWFPKATGLLLDEKLGKIAFWFWIGGFYLAFMPLYALGFMGMTRRLSSVHEAAWAPFLVTAAAGTLLILIGVAVQIWQFWCAFHPARRAFDKSGDPWGGRLLEWTTSSPPPVYNFARIPKVMGREAFWDSKQGEGRLFDTDRKLESISIPAPSAIPVLVGIAAGLAGFALVWSIWWLAIGGGAAIIALIIGRSFDRSTTRTLSPGTITRIECERPSLYAPGSGIE